MKTLKFTTSEPGFFGSTGEPLVSTIYDGIVRESYYLTLKDN